MRPPVHVAVPALVMVRFRRVVPLVPMVRLAVEEMIVVPVPSMVPASQTSSPLTSKSPAPLRVPPESSKFSAVTASTPTAVLLRVTVPPAVMAVTPAPVMVTPGSRVCAPGKPPNSIRAPDAAVKAPELVPPRVSFRVEVWTVTVPVLLKATSMVLAAPADLVKAPALLNCGSSPVPIWSKTRSV